MSDHVVKIYVEGGLEHSMYCLGTEVQFGQHLHYNMVFVFVYVY